MRIDKEILNRVAGVRVPRWVLLGLVSVLLLAYKSMGETPGVTHAELDALGHLSELLVDGALQHRAPEVPEYVELAGEEVPLDAFGVREQLDRELVVNAYHHSSTMLFMKRSARWFPTIERILREEGVPEDFKYLAVIESGLEQVVSPSGAAGVWQFMKETAPKYGLELTAQVDERYHVEKSTRAACKYLKDAKAKFGSWALAAASYNMGQGGVSRVLNAQGVDSYWELHLNSETGRYVYRLLAVKQVFERPAAFGYRLPKSTLYTPYRTRSVQVTSSILNLADWALAQGTHLKALKLLNPWLRSDALTVAPGKSYAILVPRDEKAADAIDAANGIEAADSTAVEGAVQDSIR